MIRTQYQPRYMVRGRPEWEQGPHPNTLVCIGCKGGSSYYANMCGCNVPRCQWLRWQGQWMDAKHAFWLDSRNYSRHREADRNGAPRP